MSLTQDIAHDLTQAMKEREEPRLSTLRMLKAELQKLQADKVNVYALPHCYPHIAGGMVMEP